MKDYHSEILVEVSPEEASDLISNVRGWWSTNFSGSALRKNDMFNVRFGKTWADIKIAELVPGKNVVWEVTDCYLNLLKDPREWKDTRIVWEISREGSRTRIDMTHVGLAPGKECFQDCTLGWNFYTKESLFGFITKGKGQPGVGIRATIGDEGPAIRGTLYYKNDPLPEIAEGDVIVDVEETNVEHVVSAYSVFVFDGKSFDLQTLKGDNYMVVERAVDDGQMDKVLRTVKQGQKL
jgi:hypothetical protein